MLSTLHVLFADAPPAVIFWENVPGVLSTKDNAFGCFLAGLAGENAPLEPPGGKWTNAGCVSGPQRTVAWRVLDAQYFGVAQRRRRVFVVASARKGFDPAQVLFEWDGVRRDTAPSREARQVAPTIPARSTAGGGLGTDFDCDGGLIPALSQCITTGTGQRYDPETETILPVTHSLRGEGFDASGRRKKAKDGAPRAFLEAALANHNDSCILWPFGRFKSGYGSVGKNGRAHRIMCEMAHGKAPDGADAAHSCGNRLCVNPRHLRWATRGENMADAIAHGTTTRGERHAASKLTEPGVRGVFESLAAGETHQAIADRLGVSRNAITDIAKGKNWSWLREDGTGRGTPLAPVVSGTLGANHGNVKAEHAWTGQLVAPAIRTANTSANGHGISPELAHTLDRAQGQCVAFDTTQITSAANYSSPKAGDPCHPLAAGAHAPAIAFPANLSGTQCASAEDLAPSMGAANPTAVAFQSSQSGVRIGDTHATLDANNDPRRHNGALVGTQVRRLTPTECEKLQGFEPGYTAIPWRGKPADQCPDGPRYRALGNSWAVPNVRWIGARIQRHLAGEL